MTKRQVQWAAKHDWCLSTCGGSVTVRNEYSIGGILQTSTIRFHNFNALKAWAGY